MSILEQYKKNPLKWITVAVVLIISGYSLVTFILSLIFIPSNNPPAMVFNMVVIPVITIIGAIGLIKARKWGRVLIISLFAIDLFFTIGGWFMFSQYYPPIGLVWIRIVLITVLKLTVIVLLIINKQKEEKSEGTEMEKSEDKELESDMSSEDHRQKLRILILLLLSAVIILNGISFTNYIRPISIFVEIGLIAGLILFLTHNKYAKIVTIISSLPKAGMGIIILFGKFIGIDSSSMLPEMPSSRSSFEWEAYEQVSSAVFLEMVIGVFSAILLYVLIKYKPQEQRNI